MRSLTELQLLILYSRILISQNGKFDHFDTIANNIISDSIESVQLAPDGIVTVIYPAAGNEVGKIDLIHDKDRWKNFLLCKRQPYFDCTRSF